jgi:group I intron endonuclease
LYVYIITNRVNGKVYIGQHAGQDLQAYLAQNCRRALAGRGNKVHLYNAIRKHGSVAFEIRSLVVPIDKRQMDMLEIFFIKTLESQNPEFGYNITAGGGGCLGVQRPHTEHEKESIRQAMRGREITWGDKIAAAQEGRVFSPEHRKRLSDSGRGTTRSRSAEHCRRLSEVKKLWWAKKKETQCQSQSQTE